MLNRAVKREEQVVLVNRHMLGRVYDHARVNRHKNVPVELKASTDAIRSVDAPCPRRAREVADNE